MNPSTFSIGALHFLLNGKPFVIRCGELHFARIPRGYWRHRLKMCKAMGLNAVCLYLFWNFHEWEEGTFDWSEGADAAEFCRMAQEEGLWVLVRPGPYACAEWEMGGLPWWLLKRNGIRLRSTDPQFLGPAVRYLKEVGRVLSPLQATRGGPILMVQVENEYGSFGQDETYMGELRQALLDGGIEVPLFACNPPGAIANGFRKDLFQVVNFKPGEMEQAFEMLSSFQKTGPLMNGEYYPAWFDVWGRKHSAMDGAGYLDDLEKMVRMGRSFSIYMAHGGTSFGLWSGADRPFLPDTSSYDYDAPITEAGWVTDKFRLTRQLFSKHLLPGEVLPDIPPANPVIEIPPFDFRETSLIRENLGAPIANLEPKTMEFYGQGRGCILYRTELQPGPAGFLSAKAVHDFAWIFIDGRPGGVLDRRSRRFALKIEAREKAVQLDFLVEAMGRVNFGAEIFDHKGLHAPVLFTVATKEAIPLENWRIFSLPLDRPYLASLSFKPLQAEGPAFWKGFFYTPSMGDTFLDLRTWGKGIVWVNGHCLGRFWNIGPTQTMFCPGVWLKSGKNEVIVLDFLGPLQPVMAGLDTPILDELRPELDFSTKAWAKGRPTFEGLEIAAEGEFVAEPRWQEARFKRPIQGRYLCLEALNSLDGSPFAALSGLDALDGLGQVLSKELWRILWTDSEELVSQSGAVGNVLDGQSATFWQSKENFPHCFIVDLGKSSCLHAIRCLPRGGTGNQLGRIRVFRVYLSSTPFGLTVD